MSRLFICAHTAKINSRALIDFLVDDGAIEDWFYSMRGTFFFRSELSAKDLSSKILERFGDLRHLVIDIDDVPKWGALPKTHWEKILKRKL